LKLIKFCDSVRQNIILLFYFNLTATSVRPSDHHHAIFTKKIKKGDM